MVDTQPRDSSDAFVLCDKKALGSLRPIRLCQVGSELLSLWFGHKLPRCGLALIGQPSGSGAFALSHRTTLGLNNRNSECRCNLATYIFYSEQKSFLKR